MVVALDFRVVNLAGQLSLIELAYWLKDASCYVGLDSVASHLAAAVGVCGVALFGPSNEMNWHPLSSQIKVVKSKVMKRQCSIHGVQGATCLCGVGAGQVIIVVDELIKINESALAISDG